jgi:predicted nucleotidyltransferase
MDTPQQANLGVLLFGNYRRQVLALLLLHTDEAFHLRQIARITGTQPGTLRRELDQLTQAGVLKKKSVGNLVQFSADPQCPIFEELRGILKKTVGVADVLREALAPLAGKISVAFVYGSVARGAERRASDIDVMVIGAVTLEEVIHALIPCQVQLRREINCNVYQPAEFRKKLRNKGDFLSRVMSAPRLLVLGTTNDLGKLGWKDAGPA